MSTIGTSPDWVQSLDFLMSRLQSGLGLEKIQISVLKLKIWKTWKVNSKNRKIWKKKRKFGKKFENMKDCKNFQFFEFSNLRFKILNFSNFVIFSNFSNFVIYFEFFEFSISIFNFFNFKTEIWILSRSSPDSNLVLIWSRQNPDLSLDLKNSRLGIKSGLVPTMDNSVGYLESTYWILMNFDRDF